MTSGWGSFPNETLDFFSMGVCVALQEVVSFIKRVHIPQCNVMNRTWHFCIPSRVNKVGTWDLLHPFLDHKLNKNHVF